MDNDELDISNTKTCKTAFATVGDKDYDYGVLKTDMAVDLFEARSIEQMETINKIETLYKEKKVLKEVIDEYFEEDEKEE